MSKKIWIAFVVAAISASSQAQQTGFYQDGRPERLFNPVSGLNANDTKFVKAALAANEFEIEASKIAIDNGSSEFVKEFATEMVKDHSAAKEEVIQLATHKSLTTSAMLPKDMESKLNRLRSLHGQAFDSAFISIQKDAHTGTSSALKAEINHGHDQDVKAVAVELLPTVELHYRMLLDKKTMMGSTAATNGI